MDTAFKKGTAGLRDGNGFISLKAILKIDTARYRWFFIDHRLTQIGTD